MTNNDYVLLESGLEHDLLRRYDRDPAIDYFLPQPFELSWNTTLRGSHTPDLLGLGADGRVTVWDARRLDEQDEAFRVQARITQRCCEAVGWRYEVFSGLERTERVNLMWLNGFRSPPVWGPTYVAQIRELMSQRQARLGDLFAHDDGSGELKSVVWQLVWNGYLDVDLTSRIDERSTVTANEELWQE